MKVKAPRRALIAPTPPEFEPNESNSIVTIEMMTRKQSNRTCGVKLAEGLSCPQSCLRCVLPFGQPYQDIVVPQVLRISPHTNATRTRVAPTNANHEASAGYPCIGQAEPVVREETQSELYKVNDGEDVPRPQEERVGCVEHGPFRDGRYSVTV